MNIISKHKDYYDFVVRETDNRKVYIRNAELVEIDKKEEDGYFPLNNGNYLSALFFCDKTYAFLFWEGKYYWKSDDISEQMYEEIRDTYISIGGDHYRNGWTWKYFSNKALGLCYEFDGAFWRIKNRLSDRPLKNKFNKKYNCPVIVSSPVASPWRMLLNPKLVDISFNKVIPPTEAYQTIYNWIQYIEPDQPVGGPDDMSRYEAKGFDTKTSFRPKMK